MSKCQTSKAHLLNRLEHPSNIFRNVWEVTVLLDGRQDWREINVDLSVLEQMSGRTPQTFTSKKIGKKTWYITLFRRVCEAYHPSCLFPWAVVFAGFLVANSSGLLVLNRLQHRSKIHLAVARTCRSCWQFQQLGSQQEFWGIPLVK